MRCEFESAVVVPPNVLVLGHFFPLPSWRGQQPWAGRQAALGMTLISASRREMGDSLPRGRVCEGWPLARRLLTNVKSST